MLSRQVSKSCQKITAEIFQDLRLIAGDWWLLFLRIRFSYADKG
jgi:hypothetical protein